ncbi:hypothetical protein [Alkaliphilus sp. B6464]|uniref:hypothetical protein n=1 Tax=Alkaliphilus sp. B6464 TaxID=2731219 RepID=UPI001BA6E24F|nr:hypothetical protein [Alkaliphilus sp. B6464]QUH19515.1 hypothetical protein HYG84_06170 [Alkaliphilus sp. B6464]
MLKNKPLFILFILIGLLISYLVLSSKTTVNTEDNQILKNRIAELEIENQTIKEHYKTEYELRNILDIKARNIYTALIEKDLTTLETEVSNNAKVLPDRIIFTDNNSETIYDLSNFLETPVLRQRYYILSTDKTTFTTGYEIYAKNTESIPVITMIFSYENGDWKLNSLQPE